MPGAGFGIWRVNKEDGDADTDRHNQGGDMSDKIIKAVHTIYGDADGLFARIVSDLNRGLVSDARTHLGFVDKLIKEAT